VYALPLIVIVDVAAPPLITVNLILDAVVVTQPVTLPVVSVPPAAGIDTLVTPPTGLADPTAKVIDVGAVATAGVNDVSLMVTDVLVANIVPLVLPERTEAVNVSAPSVVASTEGVTENEPELLVIVNDPELMAKSPLLVTVQ
jgi:hypothetical protein